MVLEEHERILGAYGHVAKYKNEPILRSLGFLKSDCWFGETPANPEKPAPVIQNIKTLPSNRFATLREQ